MSSATNLRAATDEVKAEQSAFQAFMNILSTMTDFSVLKNKKLLLICIGNLFKAVELFIRNGMS